MYSRKVKFWNCDTCAIAPSTPCIFHRILACLSTLHILNEPETQWITETYYRKLLLKTNSFVVLSSYSYAFISIPVRYYICKETCSLLTAWNNYCVAHDISARGDHSLAPFRVLLFFVLASLPFVKLYQLDNGKEYQLMAYFA